MYKLLQFGFMVDGSNTGFYDAQDELNSSVLYVGKPLVQNLKLLGSRPIYLFIFLDK